MKQHNSIFSLSFPLCLLGILAVTPGRAQSQNHSRSYEFGAPQGNLIPNWSFETQDAFWIESPSIAGTAEINTRVPGMDNVVEGAKSGAFIAQVHYLSSTQNLHDLRSLPFALVPGKSYTLSFYFQTQDPVAGDWQAAPEVKFNLLTGGSTTVRGTNLYDSPTWDLYVWGFTVPANVKSAELSLIAASASAAGLVVSFDDVVLEEGNGDYELTVANRLMDAEKVSFSDGMGRVHQTFEKIEDDELVASATGYNAKADPESSFMAMPVPLQVPFSNMNVITDVAGLEKSVYAANNGLGRPDAGGFPFSQQVMPLAPAGWVSEGSSPGRTWSLGNGHTLKTGFFFASTLQPPAGDPSVAANIPACANGTCLYSVAWTQDKNGRVAFVYTNNLGQTVRKAQRFNNGTGVDFSVTDYEYHPDGSLKRVRTPLDVKSGTANAFSQLQQYNSLGKLVASTSPDVGLTRIWYNRSGLIRFSQNEKQRATTNEYTYYEYDTQGRLLSEGTDRFDPTQPMSQVLADQPTATGLAKQERIGYIYDDLSTFAARTGVPASQLVNLNFGPDCRGHLVCKYHLNPDVAELLPDPKDRIVAEYFTSFDQDGRVLTTYKYHGAARAPDFGMPHMTYAYNADGKLSNFTLFPQTNFDPEQFQEWFFYDRQGRVETIYDENFDRIAEYDYHDWGPLKTAWLGGQGNTSGTRIDHDYHIQGYLKQLSASQMVTNKSIFRENLGYEGKAYSDTHIPTPTQPQFDGTISQQLYKFTADVPDPVNLATFHYDDLGRMIQDSAYHSTNATPLTAAEDINFATLTLGAKSAASGFFNYDLNGRITGQRSGGVSSADSARYTYLPGSYKLDIVTGKLFPSPPRDMSQHGTFQYDVVGELTGDHSKFEGADPTASLMIDYNWEGMPYKMHMGDHEQFLLYDADGKRAMRIDRMTTNSDVSELDHFWFINGRDCGETREVLDGEIEITEIDNLTGRGQAIVGRKWLADGLSFVHKEFFIKNHQGSIVRTVQSDGTYKTIDGTLVSDDYSAYGNPRQLVAGASAPRLSQGYSGKEFESFERLTYFGARFLDPELAMWTTPDPKAQFDNPYSFGGNPINSVDENGEYIEAIIGAVIGAITGAIEAAQAGYGFDDWQFWADIGGNAAIGAVSGGLGEGIGGVSGAIVGGYASGFGSYALNSGVQSGFKNWNDDAFMKAGFVGAAQGGVTQGVTDAAGGGGFANVAGGYAGGGVGAALSGGDAVMGGLGGALNSAATYTGDWIWFNYLRPGELSRASVKAPDGEKHHIIKLPSGEYQDADDPTYPLKPDKSTRKLSKVEKDAFDQFKSMADKNPKKETGETAMFARVYKDWPWAQLSIHWLSGVGGYSDIGGVDLPDYIKADLFFHSHPQGSGPEYDLSEIPSNHDYNTVREYSRQGNTSSFLYGGKGGMYYIAPGTSRHYMPVSY